MFFIPSASAVSIPPGPAHINVTSEVVSVRIKDGTRIVTSLLYNRRKTSRAIGNSVLVCENISNRKTLRRGELCDAIFRFPLGYIVAEGITTSRVYFRLAVLGGTGIYSHISGQMQSIATQLSPRKDKLSFALLVNGA